MYLQNRKEKISAIRKIGTFIHNTSVHNTGKLLVSRRPLRNKKVNEFKVCPKCKDFFSKYSLRRHFKRCNPEAVSHDRTLSEQSRVVHGQIHRKACTILRNQIFPKLREDSITKIIAYDELAIIYGNKLTEKYRKPHLHKMIRSKLRLIGRFLVEIKRINSVVTDFSSIFNPRLYDDVIKAVNNVALYNPDYQKYKSPATAFAYGTLFKQCGRIQINEYIKKDDEEAQRLIRNFLSILEEDYSSAINKTVEENQNEMKRLKKVVLPTSHDIKKLNIFLKNERTKYLNDLKQNFNIHSWKELAKSTLSSIQLFNRRRAGEIERITMNDFWSYETVEANTDLKVFRSLSTEEQEDAKKYCRFLIRGKRGRSVPVLLHKELVECVETVIKFRKCSGVSDNNPYVFGIAGSDNFKHLEACALLRKYSKKCGADLPTSLRGTELRKEMATSSHMDDIDDQEVNELANFMGHARQIHEQHYRIPVATRDIVRMSKLLRKRCGDNSGILMSQNINQCNK